MAKQINQYTKTRTKETASGEDLMDVDSTDDKGLTFESAKMKLAEFIGYIAGQLPPVAMYVVDGTLSSNRTITALTRFTKWLGGNVTVEMDNLVDDYGFTVNDNSSVEKARLGYDQVTSSGVLEIKDSVGTTLFAKDGMTGLGTDNPISRLDIEVPTTLSPLSFYQNRTSGALVNDQIKIDFYFNDNVGVKSISNQSIISRVENTSGSGFINNMLVFGDAIKIHQNKGVVIANSALTSTATAQLYLKGYGSPFSTTLQLSGSGNSSTNIFQTNNLNGDQLLYLKNNGQLNFNANKLSTANFQIDGSIISSLFYANSSKNAIGIGTNLPDDSALIHLNSTTKGFLPPSMTTAQRDAIVSPIAGLQVYNTTTNTPQFYNGSVWGNI